MQDGIIPAGNSDVWCGTQRCWRSHHPEQPCLSHYGPRFCPWSLTAAPWVGVPGSLSSSVMQTKKFLWDRVIWSGGNQELVKVKDFFKKKSVNSHSFQHKWCHCRWEVVTTLWKPFVKETKGEWQKQAELVTEKVRQRQTSADRKEQRGQKSSRTGGRWRQETFIKTAVPLQQGDVPRIWWFCLRGLFFPVS